MNPPTVAHFNAGAAICRTLEAAEVDMVFSINRFKDPEKYESIAHRIAMGERLKAHHPAVPFVLSDIEERIHNHITWNVLTALQNEKPKDRLVWVMGADNLAEFHTWESYEDIVTNFSMVVIDRPGYTQQALASETATKFAHQRVATAGDLIASSSPCWVFLPPLQDVAFISSSGFLKEMRAGKRVFDNGMQEIADYIITEGLYGFLRTPAPKGPGFTP
jgi:nicotinate-nucleotide adenylyltransferase